MIEYVKNSISNMLMGQYNASKRDIVIDNCN